jgi:hypothetical protein
MAAVPAILDRVRDGVRKKVYKVFGYKIKKQKSYSVFSPSCSQVNCLVKRQVDATGGLSKKLFNLAYARRLSGVILSVERFINICLGLVWFIIV